MILTILAIIATWKIYKKTGLPGWTCLIPYYSTWKLGQRCARASWLPIASIIISLVFGVFYSVAIAPGFMEALEDSMNYGTSLSYDYSIEGPMAIPIALLGVVSIVLTVIWNIDFAHSFGKSTGMGILYSIPFINIILLFVWGFGSGTWYFGPTGNPQLMGEPWRKITGGMPMVGAPYGAPMAGYPQQGAYPQQMGYPQQGGYPQQMGYPQQGGYPQQQGAYPQQQGEYVQQQGYPQQGGYPQQNDSTWQG